MKIIDLLNKIANGEELQTLKNKIEEDFNYFLYEEIGETYNLSDLKKVLNNEVEILEEEKKVPEKLNIELNNNDENKVNWYRATNLECELALKINEIIDYLKSKGDE